MSPGLAWPWSMKELSNLYVPVMNWILSDSPNYERSGRLSNRMLQDGSGIFGSKYKHDQMAQTSIMSR